MAENDIRTRIVNLIERDKVYANQLQDRLNLVREQIRKLEFALAEPEERISNVEPIDRYRRRAGKKGRHFSWRGAPHEWLVNQFSEKATLFEIAEKAAKHFGVPRTSALAHLRKHVAPELRKAGRQGHGRGRPHFFIRKAA